MAVKQLPATKLTANDATAKEELGRIRFEGGKMYRYVLAEDANITDGDVVEYSDISGYEVTNDRAGGSSIGRVVAGVAIGAITDGQYGWILVRGLHTNLKTDGTVTAGDGLIPHATADGQADVGTDSTTFGHALAADDGSTPSRVVAMVNAL